MSTLYIQLYDAPRGGSVELVTALRDVWQMNRLAVSNRTWDHIRIYQQNGSRLRPVAMDEDLPTQSIWTRLSAQLFNPRRNVRFRYEDDGLYDLDEIKSKINEYVAADDDLLTQFLDGNEISKRLRNAKNFDQVVKVIEAIHGSEDIA